MDVKEYYYIILDFLICFLIVNQILRNILLKHVERKAQKYFMIFIILF